MKSIGTPTDGPRERLVRMGREGLSDAELVALLLGTGARGEPVSVLAARMVLECGGIAGMSRMGLGSLAALRGLGFGKACRLAAAFELGRRIHDRPLSRGRRIASSRDVDSALRPRLADADVEHFLAIALDARHRPIRELSLALGGTTACPVAPSDVFRALLREAASAVIFVHNHPSGDPGPSEADVALTERLRHAGELLGISVLDHVIVAKEGYFSFLDAGLLPSRPASAVPEARP